MSSVTYTIAEQKVIKAEILASLLRQSAELAAEIEKKEAEMEALDSLKIQLLNGDAKARAEAADEIFAQAARQAFQSAEASAELRRREADRQDENKVCCDKCETCYTRNSRDHDEFIYDKDGEYGICGDCYDGEYDEDSEDEDEDEDEDEEEYVDSGAFDEMVAMLYQNEPKPEETDLFAELVAQAKAE